MFEGNKFDNIVKSADGSQVYSYEYIEWLRKDQEDVVDSNRIMPQKGGQENMLSADVDILIGGGSRGGTKTYSLLLENDKDIYNGNFKSMILRKEVDDLANIIDESRKIFQDFGEYNKSKSDMTWNLHSGGSV